MENRKKIESSPIEITLRWLLGALFVYAGVAKALDPAAFASDIANYQLLPWTLCAAMACYLPWLEIIAGAALISEKWSSASVRILLLLMLLFFQALLTAWLRGLNIHCGCFGRALTSSNYPLLFLRDAAIFMGLGWIFFQQWKRRIAKEEIVDPAPPGL